jgi:hypothetical protein
VRRPIEGNLTTRQATAPMTLAAIVGGRPMPWGYRRTSPEDMTEAYLDSVAHVQHLLPRTQDRYRAELDRFKEFTSDAGISRIDAVDENTVEDS